MTAATSVNRAVSALLGALLIDPPAYPAVAAIVTREDFPHPRGREVFDAIGALHAQGRAADIVTVIAELERRGTLREVGEGNLIDLINHCPTSLYAESYARIVADAARERRRALDQTAGSTSAIVAARPANALLDALDLDDDAEESW